MPDTRASHARSRTRVTRTPVRTVAFLNRNDEDAVDRAPLAFLAVATTRHRPEGYQRVSPTGGLNRHISHRAGRFPAAEPLRAAGGLAGTCRLAAARRRAGSRRKVTPFFPEAPFASTSTTRRTTPRGRATGLLGRTFTDRITGRSGVRAGPGGTDGTAETGEGSGREDGGGAYTSAPARDAGASARTVSAASPAADVVSIRLMVMRWRLGTGR
ncbi:hypothetical protein DQ384_19130 [Sphaerisporangium album]|uniref:Uncharacterized protein n=1 Tax=Sphaerisporangium album TaxID=509200 RepID=A0A367FJ81_9ACTN|nr:hypothetical protein DQ384_19130 [Sphaerisporangium album]